MNTGSEKTTVICAVWHADPDRHALLSGHAASLLAQSRPIKVVYVFDKGDQPPAGLIGESICVSAPLTVYEAWNVALARCTTPYVMNLNLDDRLNGDAVEHLEQALDEDIRRMVVGGDWCVRYSQADTDATTRASPRVDGIPFVPEWPPTCGTLTRLGSWRERGTLGPATMWRMASHLSFPRYPYRTRTGVPIRSIADSLWWQMLESKFRGAQYRLPLVLGNYHAHPENQAEFRYPGEREWKAVQSDPVSLL